MAIVEVAGSRRQVPVSEITKVANQGMHKTAMLMGAKVGRVCRELGFDGKKGSKGVRVIMITPEILARLKAYATNATNATPEGNSAVYQGGITQIETPLSATPADTEVADVADDKQKATQISLQYDGTSGGCGGCGGSAGSDVEYPAEVII